jgi:hypothetical protein
MYSEMLPHVGVVLPDHGRRYTETIEGENYTGTFYFCADLAAIWDNFGLS